MVSIEATERAPRPAANVVGAPVDDAVSRRRVLPLAVLAAIFLVSFGARMLAHDVVITADEDNWMRRAGGFTYGLLNGQFGRTYQNGHPGVTAMWLAMLTLGPERMVQYADRVTNLRLVGQAPGFWDALVAARPGFALVTALLVTLIAGLSWRLFGGLVGALAGLVIGLEPFLLGISQLVHMDALLSGCMVASVLMALVAWTREGSRGWLIGSGVLAGLAILSKVPAVFLLAFVPALGTGLALLRLIERKAPLPLPMVMGRGPEGRAFSRLSLDLAIWGAATAGAFVACWPAIWVLGPVEVIGRVIEFTKETGGQPHEQGTFFWGQPTADPGPFYYPVSMAFRLAPLTVLGVLLLIACWRRLRAKDRLPALALIGYGFGFLLMMTLGAKKLDRYVLPIFPALGVLAALGLATAWHWLRTPPPPAPLPREGDGSRPASAPLPRTRGMMLAKPIFAPRSGWGWGALASILVIALAAWPAAAAYPYFLAYYSPLLGGGPMAQRTIMVGNGEGLDQVAKWLNAQPDAQNTWTISHSFDILQPLIVGSGESLRDRVPSNADYVVLYRFQIQIAHSPRVLDEYLNRHTPELVVWINGVEYARIYKGPHLLAMDESTSQLGVAQPDQANVDQKGAGALDAGAMNRAPTDDGNAGARFIAPSDGWGLTSSSAEWESQVKPRLRRLRSAVARLIPPTSGSTP